MYKEWDTFSSLSEEEILRRYVSERVDLRTVVYMYLAQHPGMTQTSVAEKMGVGQVSLSRALVSEKPGLKDEMISGVIELLGEIEPRSFSRHLFAIDRAIAMQNRISRRYISIPAILSFVNKLGSGSEFELRKFSPSEEAFVFEKTDGRYKWTFFDMTSQYNHHTRCRIIAEFERMMRSPEDRLTVVCYSELDFRGCTTKRFVRDIQTMEPPRYRSVMFVNLEEKRVEAEYMLTDPNNTFDMGRFESFSSEDEWL